MELQIQDLVSSIRKEGIDAANAEAEAIIAEAKKKAEMIISDAKAEAEATKAASEKEIGILKESATLNAAQAKRDAVLSFKNEVRTILERLLLSDVQKCMSEEKLGTLIRAALSGEDVGMYAAEVAEVGERLKCELAAEIKNGLIIKPTKGVQAGFHLSAKDGSAYFDCSDEEVEKMLMPYFRNLDF